jgi:hypothetical protein
VPAGDLALYEFNLETSIVKIKRAQMTNIIFQRTYLLSEAYDSIKKRANPLLDKYEEYPDLISFNDSERNVTFFTERLIPTVSTNRPRVMLLFSNPHPLSIHQGMFLSGSSKGRENLFWPTMEAAGWLPLPKENRNPKLLADSCLKAEYQGPFEFIFYCYYAFPTDYPEHIRRIFGEEFFRQIIEPEAIDEFKKTIQETSVETIVTFNKGIFNLVSESKIERYIIRLIKGDLIQSQIKDIERDIPIYLTFPTGFIYHEKYKELRKASLDKIRTAISGGSNVPENKNT